MSTTLQVPAAGLVRPRRVRTVRVALAGCGTVGGELVRQLREGEAEIRARHGVRFELASILVRHPDKPRAVEIDPGLLTADLDAFLAADAEVVVEAIGGLHPALGIAEAALGAGRRLVTANKALVAAHGPRLAALARRRGARLDFESAVGGGIPVVRALRDSLALTGITAVRGILNGTTNYVLTRLAQGWRYADALADAQARGFAEADPERDVSGQDAADKTRILAWLAFGVAPEAVAVRRRGIAVGADRLARAAAASGGVLRLVAECVRTEDGVVASVEPTIVAPGSGFGRTLYEENAVLVESAYNGSVRLSGPGAGGAATASALLGDMVRGGLRIPRPVASAVVAQADRRAHRWVLAVTGRCAEDDLLARTLARAGIEAESAARGDGEVYVRTAPHPWSRIDLATRMLESSGCAPVVARLETERN
jgi:homoserine dehydrogenase